MSFAERKEYICNRDKFLELKELQKKVSASLKSNRIATQNFYQKRRDFYHSKGIHVPSTPDYQINKEIWTTQYERDGFVDKLPTGEYSSQEARYLNIIYGIIKGKTYDQIEQKVREGNRPTGILFYCTQFGIDKITTEIMRKEAGLI
jgi:hypothetical protein